MSGGEIHTLRRDFETRGVLDLKEVGAHRYAADSRTEVLCIAYAVDDGAVELWVQGDPVPAPWREAANNPDWEVEAHNDAFESAIEKYFLAPRYGFPLVPIERHRCSMVMASALGLPSKLEKLAEALGLENRKDEAGYRQMMQMTKPRKKRKGETADGILYHDDPDRRQRLGEYCKQDVKVEREASDVLRALAPEEHKLWQLTAIINDRGFHVDRAFAEAARKITEAAAPEANIELTKLTEGEVTSVNQVAKLHAWLRKRGYAGKSLNKKVVEKQLASDKLTPVARQVVELRLGSAHAATNKIDALLAWAGDDDRVRGGFKHHGASTGRWAGQGFQPQNLKRIDSKTDLEAAIAAVATGDYNLMREKYDKPLAIVGECSRPMICAAPGHALMGADFSSIESRVLAWIAGEEWKVESYRRFDQTHDPRDEPYCITACKIYRVPDGTVTKKSDPEKRGNGKICDLAFGYGGGLRAWRNFDTSDRYTDEEVQKFKTDWRTTHPRIKQFWEDIDRAACIAVSDRGRIVPCGGTLFKCFGSFLAMKLPSGRKVSYPFPRIMKGKYGPAVTFMDNAQGKFADCNHGNGAYGGIWTENLVSGIARDLLALAMLRIEAAGYPIILTVHDEIVVEVPEGFGSEEEFTRLMTQLPDWAAGLPVTADVWTDQRYTK